MTKRFPFRYFKTSPDIIRLAVMMYDRFPLSLRNVEDLLHGGIEIGHETVRFRWHRFGPMFASEREVSARPEAVAHHKRGKVGFALKVAAQRAFRLIGGRFV